MLRKSYWQLMLWIFSIMSISSLIGAASRPHHDTWYLNLSKSTLTPPSYVFGIVWPFLYFLIAIAGWKIWSLNNSNKKPIQCLFTLQLLLNWLWSPIFFYFHNIYLAFMIILSILLTLTALFILLKNHKTLITILIPYYLWSLFALYLNGYTLINNTPQI